jgi:PAS domain S-box-containing protein
MDDALPETKELYATLIDQAPDGFILFNKEGAIFLVNQQLSTLVGHTQEELLQLSIKDIVPVDDKPHVLTLLSDITTLTPVLEEHLMRKKDGSTIPVEGHYILRTDGLYLGFIHDISNRMKQEEKLKESEELYRTLVDTFPDAVVLTDMKATISFASKSAMKMYGTDDPNELIGKSSYDFIAPEDRARATANALKSLAGSTLHNIEYQCIRKDGSRYFSELHVTLLKDVHRLPKGFVGITHDITDRKNIEQQIKDSEERLKLYLENISDVISVIDSNGIILYESQSCRRTLGYEPGEMVGKSGLTWLHPDDVEKVKQSLGEGFSHVGAIQMMELRYQHKDGTWRILEGVGKSTRDGKGNVYAIISSHDITDRKETEERLRKQEEELEVITKHALDVVGHIDAKRIVTYISPSVQVVFGYNPKDLIGRPITDHVHKDDIEPVTLAAREAMQSHKSTIMQVFRYQKKDGEYRWIEVNFSLLYDDAQAYIGSVFGCRDVTDRKKAQEELEARAKDLELMNQAMVGRELKMAELKKELSELKSKLGQ